MKQKEISEVIAACIILHNEYSDYKKRVECILANLLAENKIPEWQIEYYLSDHIDWPGIAK